MDVDSIKLRADVVALKLAVASLIRELPDAQKARVLQTMASLTKASDFYNAELPAFSIGEEATYQLQNALSELVKRTTEI